ncbi:MAG: 16S rRNA (cytosine(967)-C(5))-methyltransferase RsmB, partial [Ruminococcus sp.]|nr:16S rRNA (cytosine(967)-C(5))-methyltransferase RsmB [Ruminococcus sp.]
KYSCPEWLVKKWCREYGKENTESLLSASINQAETILRVNTVKTTAENLKQMLSDEGINCSDGYIADTLRISLSGTDIESLNTYKLGLFHVQDTASTLCSMALDAGEGDTVFDLCSAPGGKAFTIAELMNNKGRVLAFDLYPHRTELISSGAERLGLNIIKAQVGDAAEFDPKIGLADRVLCDVVCSGLGIIRRKPEIKYKSEDSLSGLPEIQFKILCNASKYVKTGGRLIYSTCTLNKDENENVCKKFLDTVSDFVPAKPLEQISDDFCVTLMPHINNTDGFFVAAFERI